MNERRYLSWPQKMAYGTGDFAANCSYALITTFVMIYLTDTVGLNPGIIGILIGASKLLDGVSDIIFGTIIDRTKSKMGKARPWMLYSQIGISVSLILLFVVPAGISDKLQYAYFFVVYTALNSIFYTANNIAYSTLTALITRNVNERVQLGSIRFVFAMLAGLVVQTFTISFVTKLGGGTVGWRSVAIIYSIIAIVVNTFSCLMVKELPEEPDDSKQDIKEMETSKNKNQIGIVQSAKYLLQNKYYILILLIYLFNYFLSGVGSAVSIYFVVYILKVPSMMGTFSLVGMVPMIISLALTPILVKRTKSMWRVNTWGYAAGFIVNIINVFAALNLNIPLMLVTAFIKGLLTGPMMGTINALIAEASLYTFKTKGVRLDGTMYSCSSLGMKLGGGIGSAFAGLLLNIGGYDGLAKVQSASAISMISFMFIWIPLIVTGILTVLLYLLKVEKANRDLEDKELTENLVGQNV